MQHTRARLAGQVLSNRPPKKKKMIRDQLETVQDTILPLPDAILRLIQYAAMVTGEASLAVMNATLEEMRKAEGEAVRTASSQKI